MNRRLLALAIVLLFVVAGVRVVDPAFDNEEVTVEFEDRPSIVAADSIRKLQQDDRTVEVRMSTVNATGNRQSKRLIRISVEASAERYRSVIRSTDPDENAPPVAYFGTEGRGWIQQNYPDAEWNAALSVRYPKYGPIFEPDAIERGDGDIVHENASTFVVRINDSEVANAAVERSYGYVPNDIPGYLIVAIDKEHKRPQWAIRAYSAPDRNTTVYYRYRFSEYGEATVERPDGVPPFSILEFLGDIYYG